MSVIDESDWWVGLYRDSWTWSDQRDTSFTVLALGEPNGHGGEPFTAASLKGWINYSSPFKMAFICSSKHSNFIPV